MRNCRVMRPLSFLARSTPNSAWLSAVKPLTEAVLRPLAFVPLTKSSAVTLGSAPNCPPATTKFQPSLPMSTRNAARSVRNGPSQRSPMPDVISGPR